MQHIAHASNWTLFTFLNETPLSQIKQDRPYVVAMRFSDGTIRFVGPFTPVQRDHSKAPHKDFSWFMGKFIEENSIQKTVMLPNEGRAIFYLCIEYALLEWSSKLKNLMSNNVTYIEAPERCYA